MWEVISALSGLATLLIMVFIEWPTIRVRWAESASAMRKIFTVVYILSTAIGFILFQIGMWPNEQIPLFGDSTLGQIGLWIYNLLLALWVFSIVRKNSRFIFTDIITFLTLVAFVLSLFLNVWMYYYS